LRYVVFVRIFFIWQKNSQLGKVSNIVARLLYYRRPQRLVEGSVKQFHELQMEESKRRKK